MKFYRCEHCGNIITFLHDAGVLVHCCGQKMSELVPGTVDAALEKHVPVVHIQGRMVTVQVGSVEHPMIPEHYIQWIAVETKQGCQIKHLSPGQKPAASFALSEDDEFVAAYEYCNLHRLWKS